MVCEPLFYIHNRLHGRWWYCQETPTSTYTLTLAQWRLQSPCHPRLITLRVIEQDIDRKGTVHSLSVLRLQSSLTDSWCVFYWMEGPIWISCHLNSIPSQKSQPSRLQERMTLHCTVTSKINYGTVELGPVQATTNFDIMNINGYNMSHYDSEWKIFSEDDGGDILFHCSSAWRTPRFK